MCCWPYREVILEEPPPKKKAEKKPKEYIIASSDFNVQPIHTPTPPPPRAGNPWRQIPARPQASTNKGSGKPLPQPGEQGNPWTDPALRPVSTGGRDPWLAARQINDPWDNPPHPPIHNQSSYGGAREEQIGPNLFIRHSGTGKGEAPIRPQNPAPNAWDNPAPAPANGTAATSRARQRTGAAVDAILNAAIAAADRDSRRQQTDQAADAWTNAANAAAARQGRHVHFAQGVVFRLSGRVVKHIFTSPAPMHYPNGTQLYRSTLARPGPSNGNTNKPGAGSAQGGSGIHANGAAQRVQLVPEVPTGNDIYWCKELTGGFVARTTNDIMNNCQPGAWRTSDKTGFPYFERFAKQ
ncbi:MAG: hypothetical protein Q9217_006642 [Psora testacea]